MNGYFASFLVYTMAMAGIMLISVIIYKKVTSGRSFGAKKNMMEIEESLNLSARKTLHVVRVGNERFLIASDAERTAFLAKLDENSKTEEIIKKEITDSPRDNVRIIPGINPEEIRRARLKKESERKRPEKTFAQIFEDNRKLQSPVMKSLAEKMQLSKG